MKQRICRLLLLPFLLLMPLALTPAPVYACGHSSAAQQVINGVSQAGSIDKTCGQGSISHAVGIAVQILSFIVGVAAIITIIWGGFKYITSGGDSGKVGNAKNTLIYAIVGLAVAVVAQIIVNVVITQTSSAVNCKTGEHLDAKNNCVKD